MTTETGGRETGPDLTRSLIAAAMREVGFTAPEQTAGQLFVTDAGKTLRRFAEAGYRSLCCCLGGVGPCDHHAKPSPVVPNYEMVLVDDAEIG